MIFNIEFTFKKFQVKIRKKLIFVHSEISVVLKSSTDHYVYNLK